MSAKCLILYCPIPIQHDGYLVEGKLSLEVACIQHESSSSWGYKAYVCVVYQRTVQEVSPIHYIWEFFIVSLFGLKLQC